MTWIRNDDNNDSSDSDDDSNEEINIIGSSIYFYCDVSDSTITKLITELRKLEIKLRKRAIELDGYKPKIKLYIRSNGGEVYAGFSAMDHISSMKIPVDTIADGICASAATFLLLAGRKRYATPNTRILIHQISSGGFWGKYDELKDDLKHCNSLMEQLKKLYSTKCEIPEKKLSKLMKRDIYLSADECLEFKVIEKISCP